MNQQYDVEFDPPFLVNFRIPRAMTCWFHIISCRRVLWSPPFSWTWSQVFKLPRNPEKDLVMREMEESKKSPTGPTERTAKKPEDLVARSQLTERGPLRFGPIRIFGGKNHSKIFRFRQSLLKHLRESVLFSSLWSLLCLFLFAFFQAFFCKQWGWTCAAVTLAQTKWISVAKAQARSSSAFFQAFGRTTASNVCDLHLKSCPPLSCTSTGSLNTDDTQQHIIYMRIHFCTYSMKILQSFSYASAITTCFPEVNLESDQWLVSCASPRRCGSQARLVVGRSGWSQAQLGTCMEGFFFPEKRGVRWISQQQNGRKLFLFGMVVIFRILLLARFFLRFFLVESNSPDDQMLLGNADEPAGSLDHRKLKRKRWPLETHSWAYHRWSRHGTYELCLVLFKVLGGSWYLWREGILRFESQMIYRYTPPGLRPC